MPLFPCRRCRCIENTALGDYWCCEVKLCSECKTGKWHNRFKKISSKGMLVDQNGCLWDTESVEAGNLPNHYEIVGEII